MGKSSKPSCIGPVKGMRHGLARANARRGPTVAKEVTRNRYPMPSSSKLCSSVLLRVKIIRAGRSENAVDLLPLRDALATRSNVVSCRGP